MNRLTRCTRKEEHNGRKIPEGTLFWVFISSGNRDPSGSTTPSPVSWIARSFYMHGSRAIPCPRAEQLFEVSARNGKLMVPVVYPSSSLPPSDFIVEETGGTILLCTGICGEPSLRDKINTVVRFFFACPIFLRNIVPHVFFFFVVLFFLCPSPLLLA